MQRGLDCIKDDSVSVKRLSEAVNVILTLQNHDGGWATYENNRGYGWYEWLNPSEVFGDIMIDYSYVECSMACATALRAFIDAFPSHTRSSEILLALGRGNTFLKSIQRKDGSWYGSWGCCFTYAVWFGIEGLVATGEDPETSRHVQKACTFLISKQRSDGGWGETFESCFDKRYSDGPSHVVNTAWALLGLMAGHCTDINAVDRGMDYLLHAQESSGDWPQQGISGVFNRACGITYTAYRNVFPIWALARYHSYYRPKMVLANTAPSTPY
mmetsp:Transcript_20141/g.24969  ORF Transcript_20141/g.24969 Transcript_20141/m.24969 type:complete len:271 (+) Transcript_20141:29-841(+)